MALLQRLAEWLYWIKGNLMGSDRARKDRIAKLAVAIWHRRGRSFLRLDDVIKETLVCKDRVLASIKRWHSEGWHVWDVAEWIIDTEERGDVA